ncbi:hypothetical protein OL239_04050 [Arthrobacter sp. ATA002]|nr:hypothetical protein [Arthrobacter sp. ATA002]WAP53466.1 hypothetical protein OL239_04050 [Arthrobacter sp. ATA002]
MTWAGCGQHVQQVMAHIPRTERCACDKSAPKASPSKGWLTRLLGR